MPLTTEQIQELLWRFFIQNMRRERIALVMGIKFSSVKYQIEKHSRLYQYPGLIEKAPKTVRGKHYKDYLSPKEWSKWKPIWKETGLLEEEDF